MNERTLADLLVLGLLFIGNARFIFILNPKKDTLSVTSFIGFFIAIINIAVFNLSLTNLLVLILSLWCSVWNVRAFLRMISDVVTDQYEVKLKFICAVNTLLCVFLIVVVIYFRPMNFELTKLPVKQNTVLYSGDFETGFSEIKTPFVFSSMKVFNFEPEKENPVGRTIIIFIPPETTDSELYTVFFQKLANNGFSVYSADFYGRASGYKENFLRAEWSKRFFFLKKRFYKETEYDEYIKNNNSFEKKFNTLLSICRPSNKDTVFLVTEDDVTNSLSDVIKRSEIFGCFDLSYINGYKTKGFGPVENTDPLFGALLGVQPDRSGYLSSHLGTVVTDFINSQMISRY